MAFCVPTLPAECTVDQHFVFAIRYNSASIPVDPTKLVIPGNPQCKPVIVNNRVAIFKFKITECGTHSYVSFCFSPPLPVQFDSSALSGIIYCLLRIKFYLTFIYNAYLNFKKLGL